MPSRSHSINRPCIIQKWKVQGRLTNPIGPFNFYVVMATLWLWIGFFSASAIPSSSPIDPSTVLFKPTNFSASHNLVKRSRFSKETGAGGSRLTDEQMLLRSLLENYERSARPVLSKVDRVTVGLGLTITQIFELDERNEVLITNVWLDQEWFDEYLQWNTSDHGDLRMIRIPSSKIWLPDIVLYNNAADYSTRIVETRAMVSSDGYVFWPLPVKLFSSCKVNVKYFPFDEQVCHMKFGSWTYDGFKVDLTNRTEGADLSMYIQNGEWDLLSVLQRRNVVIYTCCEEPYPDVTFYIYIKRKTLYYLHNVFFPCFVMSTLTLLVFLLPPDSGEKCALGITVMLAFAVFMLTVIEKLPETSESVPLISIYLTVVMSMTAVSVILTVIVLNLHHKTARSWRLAAWVLRLLDTVAPLCCLHSSPKTDKIDPLDGYERRPKLGRLQASVTFANEEAEILAQDRHRRRSSALRPLRSPSTSRQIIRISSGEFLDELETEIDALGSGYFSAAPKFTAVPPDHALALAVVRMMERHRFEVKTEDVIRDWRRLSQVVDRFLFWLFFIVILCFTIFILVLAPNEKLLG